MKIVLDTNVLISGFLNPHGTPGKLVRMVAANDLTLCYDSRIYAEYHEVLRRPNFYIPPESIDIFLDQIEKNGEIVAGETISKRLPDPDDVPFLELARSANVPLVTGNLKDFPVSAREGVQVLSPADFLELLREE